MRRGTASGVRRLVRGDRAHPPAVIGPFGPAAASPIAGELWWPWLLNDDRIEARGYLEAALDAPGLSAVDRGRLLLGAAFLDLDRYQPPGREVELLSTLADRTGEASLQGWAQLLTATASAAISTRLLPTFVSAERRREIAARLDAAAKAFTVTGDIWASALTAVLQAVVELTGGDGRAATLHLAATHGRVVELGDPWLSIKHTQTRGVAAMLIGELTEATRLHRDALVAAEREELRESQATLHSQLGGLALAAGQLEQARQHFEACLSLVHRLGITPAEAWPRNGLGMLARRHGDPETAIEHHQRALDLYQAVNHRVGVPYSLALLGLAHTASGHPQDAAISLQQAYDAATANGEPAVAALALIGLAETAVGDDREVARRHLADARRLLTGDGDRSPLVPLPGNYDLARITALLQDSNINVEPLPPRQDAEA